MSIYARASVAIFLILMSAVTSALTTTTGCNFAWDWTGDEATIDGFRFYIDGKPMDLPADVRKVSCAEADVMQGQHEAWVTVFNAVGESDPSNKVKFTFLTTVPAPAVLRLEIGL